MLLVDLDRLRHKDCILTTCKININTYEYQIVFTNLSTLSLRACTSKYFCNLHINITRLVKVDKIKLTN